MDYKSPIEILTGEPIFKEMDDGVMRATVNCGVHVDKEELLKALAYDRGQYEKGYEDATKGAIVFEENDRTSRDGGYVRLTNEEAEALWIFLCDRDVPKDLQPFMNEMWDEFYYSGM